MASHNITRVNSHVIYNCHGHPEAQMDGNVTTVAFVWHPSVATADGSSSELLIHVLRNSWLKNQYFDMELHMVQQFDIEP